MWSTKDAQMNEAKAKIISGAILWRLNDDPVSPVLRWLALSCWFHPDDTSLAIVIFVSSGAGAVV